MDLVMVDPWSAGNYGAEEEQTWRLTRALSWVRSDPADNGYAHPIEGVLALVDLNSTMTLRADDLQNRHVLSPYIGRNFRGVVRQTLRRGETIFIDGKFRAPPVRS